MAPSFLGVCKVGAGGTREEGVTVKDFTLSSVARPPLTARGWRGQGGFCRWLCSQRGRVCGLLNAGVQAGVAD